MLIAFENGDIAAITMASSPIRNNSSPYLGCRVLDGTTTEHDWIGFVKTKDLPRGKNPRKGFYVSANNRVMPDFVKDDLGTMTTSTARAQRIVEMIRRQLELGYAFDDDDIKKIMNDKVDIQARDAIELIIKMSV